jgi:hypothetical protein
MDYRQEWDYLRTQANNYYASAPYDLVPTIFASSLFAKFGYMSNLVLKEIQGEQVSPNEIISICKDILFDLAGIEKFFNLPMNISFFNLQDADGEVIIGEYKSFDILEFFKDTNENLTNLIKDIQEINIEGVQLCVNYFVVDVLDFLVFKELPFENLFTEENKIKIPLDTKNNQVEVEEEKNLNPELFFKAESKEQLRAIKLSKMLPVKIDIKFSKKITPNGAVMKYAGLNCIIGKEKRNFFKYKHLILDFFHMSQTMHNELKTNFAFNYTFKVIKFFKAVNKDIELAYLIGDKIKYESFIKNSMPDSNLKILKVENGLTVLAPKGIKTIGQFFDYINNLKEKHKYNVEQ